MKKMKFIIIALVVLALLVGAYFIAVSLTKEEPLSEDETPEEVVVYDLSNDTVITINYSNGQGDSSYTYMNDIWYATVDRAMPIDQSFVQTMAGSLQRVVATREITGEGDESAYGFDNPTLSYSVGSKGGKTNSVVVGAFNEMSQGYYLKYEDRIFIVDSTVVDATSYSLFDSLIRTELPEITAESIKNVTVNGEAVSNPAGYANIGITVVEDYKNKESYGFDGSENVVVVSYTETTDITDEMGNVTSTLENDKSYTFSYAVKDTITYFMLPDDTLIYQGTGTEAFFEAADTEESDV